MTKNLMEQDYLNIFLRIQKRIFLIMLLIYANNTNLPLRIKNMAKALVYAFGLDAFLLQKPLLRRP